MLYAIVAVLVLILDQGLKYWTTLNITLDTGMKELIPGVLHLANVHNNGAAFGILQNARWLFVVLAVILTVVVIVALAKNIIQGKFGRWVAVLILAGALGNCIDRIISGYVVDMFELEFMTFPVFNVADIFITVGGILFCFYIMFHKEPEISEEEKTAMEEKQQRLARQRAVADQQDVADIRTISKEKGGKTAARGAKADASSRAKAQPQVSEELEDDYDPFAEWNADEGKEEIRTAEVRDPREVPIFVPPADKTASDSGEEPASAPKRKMKPSGKSFRSMSEEPAKPVKHADPKPPMTPEKPAPAPKAGDMDFSLEDILQEFKDL